MKLFKRRIWDQSWRERGDTLVEVVMAFAILSLILGASTSIAVKSFQLGQTARERTGISNEAQKQMEALRGFRDNHKWIEFLNGSSVGSPYQGALTAGTNECVVTSPCLTMKLVPGKGYFPQGGKISGSVPTSYIEISVVPAPGSGPVPQSVDVKVSYGFDNAGGGADNAGHIQTRLTDVAYVVATPLPTPPPPSAKCNVPNDLVLLLDSSNSMTARYLPSVKSRADRLKEVLSDFVNNIAVSPAGIHMGIMQFWASTGMLIQLTDNESALQTAASNYETFGGTRITPGMQAVDDQMFSSAAARPGASKTLVLLSDGRPNAPDSEAQVRAKAAAMGAAGVKIYTILIGPDDDFGGDLMRDIVQNGGVYANAQFDTDLDIAFANIAQAEGCK